MGSGAEREGEAVSARERERALGGVPASQVYLAAIPRTLKGILKTFKK